MRRNHLRHGAAWLLLMAATRAAPAAAQDRALYRDPTQSIDTRVRDLLARMTPVEKLRQLFMAPADSAVLAALDMAPGLFGLQVRTPAGVAAADAPRVHAARVAATAQAVSSRSRLGIPPLMFEEALHGLLADGAPVFPQAIALAATFDTALVARVHTATAAEARRRGIRMVLSPVVNLATDVRWGRTEETFGEDPWLVAAMGRAHVRAFEQAGVVATPKHFVANVGDGGRDSWPVAPSTRLLEERFFPPFQSAIADAGARSLMTAYNSIDGTPATQHRGLLTTTLRERWGFGGFTISDASATSGAVVLHHTAASTAEAFRQALDAGLDVVFQGGLADLAPYERAVGDGLIPDSLLDRATARVLRVKFALGLFDDTASALPERMVAAELALAREAAAAGVVLLHHRTRRGVGVLPLATNRRRLALIGPDADSVRLGGYSGSGVRPVSLRAALRGRQGRDVQAVRYVRGPGRRGDALVPVPASAWSHEGGPGLQARFWSSPDFMGAPLVTRVEPALRATWTLGAPARGLADDWYGVRFEGTLTVPAGGVRALAYDGPDGIRLWVDDRLVLDRSAPTTAQRWVVPQRLAAGAHRVRFELEGRRAGAAFALSWDAGPPARTTASAIAEAVAAARASDVAIVTVGVDEGEFQDRSSLSLPGAQDALIRAVAATGVPTIVVCLSGTPILMPWLDDVAAVLQAWYPGEQGGLALADILLGDIAPSGRLPYSWPAREGQLPYAYDARGTGRGDDYVDGRGDPRFPFGHGLSTTTFAYDSLRVVVERGRAGPDARVTVTARVRNTGPRAGHEVVQLYVRDVVASVAPARLMLRGVSRVALAPGEARVVRFDLDARALQWLDSAHRWTVEPGEFSVHVGASSRDLRLRGMFTLTP